MRLKIQLYYTPECPRDPIIKDIKDALSELGVEDYEIEEVMLANDYEARQHRVMGVPTIRINGEDLDPNFKDRGEYKASCTRLYKWKGSIYDRPPKEMIKERLMSVLK